MTDGRPIPVRPVAITIRSATYRGTYFVDRSVVYVRSRFGIRSAKLDGASPLVTAKALLSELATGRSRTASK